MLKIGNVDEYTVIKETDIAYMIKSEFDDTEIFLHFNQCPRPLKIGEKVKAFLYYDQKKRLAATLEKPIITCDKVDFVEVIEKFKDMGMFVNIGISKDILLSKDYLPRNEEYWPKVGTYLPCIIKVKTDQLTARIMNQADKVDEINKLEKGTKVKGTVYNVSKDGINVLTKDMNNIFIHHTLMRNKAFLGDIVECKIININELGNYNGTMVENKEVLMFDDAKIILHYLESHGGSLMLSDKSSVEEINRYFNMSKSAFKRAIGNLYHNRLIIIKENLIKLID